MPFLDSNGAKSALPRIMRPYEGVPNPEDKPEETASGQIPQA